MDFLELKIARLSVEKLVKYSYSSGALAILPLPPSLQTFFTTSPTLRERMLQIFSFYLNGKYV